MSVVVPLYILYNFLKQVEITYILSLTLFFNLICWVYPNDDVWQEV